MSRTLLTSWTDYRQAALQLLGQARACICIYDEDLSQLGLDSPEAIAHLQRVLQDSPRDKRLIIAVRQAEVLKHRHPRLMKLLETYEHVIAAQQTSEELAHLRDSMLIVDEVNALIRFDKDQARSKILLDEPKETRPYLDRFNEIMEKPGYKIHSSALGL